MSRLIPHTILSFLLTFFLSAVQAQNEKRFYVDINTATSQTIYECWDQRVSIQYFDQIDYAKELPLTIYDSKKKKMAEITLAKTRGVNHFLINLNELKPTWDLNSIYSFQLKAENGRIYEFFLKIVAPSSKQPPTVAITFTPVQLSCSVGDSQLIDFFGDIKSAVLPYKVSWYVVNEARSSLLYQPRQETITNLSLISSIKVDKAPSYYVTLFVTDACGRTSQKTVFVKCQNGTKNISTLSFEPMDKATLDKLNGITN